MSVVLLGVASASADSSLVGEWHMDQITMPGEGTSATPDSSGNRNDLTGGLSGNPLISGRWGQAIEFNAADFDQLATNSTVLEPQQLTVMAWVKGEPGPGADKFIVAQGGDPACDNPSYGLFTTTDQGIQFFVTAGNDPTFSPESGPGIWDAQWHAVAGTYDGTTVRLYVDGNEVGSGTPDTAAINYQLSTTDFVAGGYPDPNCHVADYHYSGGLDELRVYNRALSADEVNELQTATGDTPPELGGSTTTSTSTATSTSTSTSSTTTSATTSSPPLNARPVAQFVGLGPSKTLKGSGWFNGATSLAGGGAHIVNYNWLTQGPGQVTDGCGPSPIVSLPFSRTGPHTVELQVTNSAGQTSTVRRTINVTANMVNRAPGAGSVYDCENPGGSEQASTADCIKTFGFGIIDVNSRGSSDDCFTITRRFRGPALPPGLAPDARAALNLQLSFNNQFYYHATIPGSVSINGVYIPLPAAVKTQYDSGDSSIGVGSYQLKVGPFTTPTVDLSQKVVPQNIPVGDCYSHVTQGYHLLPSGLLSKSDTIGGLPVQGGIAVDWLDHSTRIIAKIGLPNIFGFAPGQPAQGTLCLNLDNVHGFSFDGAQIGPIPNAFIGPIALQNLSFTYSKDDNLWSGGATVTFPGSPVSLNASPPPPDLGFGIKDGHFDHAGIGIDFGPGAQPQLFPDVFLTNIHVALGIDPLRFTGGVGLTAAQILQINGDVFIAFASPDQPYDFPTTGGDLAPLSGKHLTSFTIAVGGNATAKVPFLDQLPLANAYLLYEFPDYFQLGGGFEFDPPLLKITGSMLGFVDPAQSAFNLQGQVSACLRDSIHVSVGPIGFDVKPCFSTGAIVSSKGIGFCGTIPVPTPFGGVIPVQVTVGYKWGDSGPGFGWFSCDFGSYQVNPTREVDGGGGASGARAAAAAPGFSLPSGVPAASVRVTGTGGPPDVVLSGPGGRTISTTNPPSSTDVIVIRIPAADETLIELRKPAAGQWSVAAAPGSPAISAVAIARALPAPAIHATVTGHGSTRTLTYRLTIVPGRAVTFSERGLGVYHVLGPARGARGRIMFVPASGVAGRRQIVAEITQDGTPVRDIAVTSYAAPAPARLRAPRRLRVSHTGTRLVVNWAAVGGAWRYAVNVVLAGGRRELLLARHAQVVFVGIPPTGRGGVTVTAIGADGRRGIASGLRFGPGPRRTPDRALN